MASLTSYRKQFMSTLNKKARRKASQINNIVRNDIIKEMRTPKSGREYKVPGTNRTYIASAPGEYPAIRTGALRSSIAVAVTANLFGVFAVIGTNTPYAVFLEGGLRPFLSLTLVRRKEDIDKVLREGWF